jgi:flagellar assembly protein FliH
MLSKVLRGGSRLQVQAVRWRPGATPEAISYGSASAPALSAQAQQSSRALLANDEGQARQMHARVAELEASIERQVEEARRQGFQDGEASGRQQAAAQVEAMLARLARSIDEVRGVKRKLRDEAEADLLQLALAIARKVLHRELNTDPEAIAGLIRVALERMNARDIIKIRVHPGHREVLQQRLAQLHPGSAVEIAPEPKLEAGSLIIETIRGEFDVSVDTNLKEIERGLTDRLRKSDVAID